MQPQIVAPKRKPYVAGQCDFCAETPRWSVRCQEKNADDEDWFFICDTHLADGVLHGLEGGRYQIMFARLAR